MRGNPSSTLGPCDPGGSLSGANCAANFWSSFALNKSAGVYTAWRLQIKAKLERKGLGAPEQQSSSQFALRLENCFFFAVCFPEHAASRVSSVPRTHISNAGSRRSCR